MAKATRGFSLIFLSLLVGVASTRFIVSRSGMMPYWMDMSIRFVLSGFGNDYPAPEDIIDVSILGTLLACWITSAVFIFAASQSSRRANRSITFDMTVVAISFAGAYFLAQWISDVFIPHASFSEHADDFRDLYMFALLLICWLMVLTVLRLLLLTVYRFRMQSRQGPNSR